MDAISSIALTFLANALWQGTLVAAVAAIVDRPMRKAPARYRHTLWIAALVSSAALPMASLRGARTTQRTEFAAPGEPVVIELPARPPAAAPAVDVPAAAAPTPRSATALARWGRFVGRHRRVLLPPFLAYGLMAAYFAFVFYRLVRLGLAWRRTRDLRATAEARELPPHLASIIWRSQAALGLPAVPVRCSSRVVGPVALGVRRAVVLLPEALFEADAAEDASAALAHELAHVRRHDFLTNLSCELALLPVAVYPAAVFMKRRIDETRELACDEVAARLVSAPAYAQSLVRMARRMSRLNAASMPRPGYTLSVFDANILEERVMRLLDKNPRPSSRWAAALLVLGSLILAASCLAASSLSLTVAQTSDATAAIQPFLGTWKASFEGKTFAVLKLRLENNEVAGTLAAGDINVDDRGEVSEVIKEAGKEEPIFDTKLEGDTLRFKRKDGDDVDRYEMRVTGEREAQLKFVMDQASPGGQVIQPFKLVRQEDTKVQSPATETAPRPAAYRDSASAHAPLAAVKSSKQAGVAGGVVGGVVGGSSDGVSGGIIGGVPESESADTLAKSREQENMPEQHNAGRLSVSGIVTDPSGARVPNAVVSLIDESANFNRTVATDETGEYSFHDLLPGLYELKVSSPGFDVHSRRNIVLSADSASPPFFPVVLEPSIVTESLVVKAKAEPSAPGKPEDAPPRRIRVGGNIESAKRIEGRQPDYPEEARAKGIEGTVVLEAVISMQGVPLSLKVVSSPDPSLSDAAENAVKEWRYKPTLLNGEPIEVVTTITVRFELER